MANRSSKHSRKANGWLSALIVILIIACAGVGLVGYYSEGFQSWERFQKAEPSDALNMDASLNFEIQDSKNMVLTKGDTVVSSDQTSVSCKLNATVYPENAVNSEVDFIVSWDEDSALLEESVSDYVTVIPDFDGAASATVYCFKPFGDNKIIITVRTRTGGIEAKCIVSYIGLPTVINASTSLVISNTSARGNYYALGKNQTYNFRIDMDNPFHQCYPGDFRVDISGFGSVYMISGYASNYGTTQIDDIYEKQLSEFVDKFFIDISVSENIVSITTGGTLLEDYSEDTPSEYGEGEAFVNRYLYPDPLGIFDDMLIFKSNETKLLYQQYKTEQQAKCDACYFTVTISEQKSGITTSFNVFIESKVNEIQLDKSEIEF